MKKTGWMLMLLLALAMLLTAGGVASAEEVITPELEIFVNSHGSMDMIAHPYAVIPSDYVAPAGFTPHNSFEVHVNNAYRFWERYHTAPRWSVMQTEGDPVSFTVTESNMGDDSQPYILVTLDATPQTAQEILFEITCDWGDYATQTGTKAFYMDFLEVELPSPETSMTTFTMKVGLEQLISPDFGLNLGWTEGKAGCNLFFSQDGYFPSSYGFRMADGQWLKPRKAGNVTGIVSLSYANLYLEKLVLFRIADEEGNFPEPVPETVPLDETHFPDAGFRAYIADTWDRNGDGMLNAAELINTRWVDLVNEEAMSLKGIGYLPRLDHVSINNTPVSSLDLTENSALESVFVTNAGLTKLNVNGLTGLQSLWCENNNLRQLEIVSNPNLRELTVRDTSIRSIDLSGNPLLTSLDLYGCQQMRTLDLSHNFELESLYCSNSGLTALDLSQNPSLRSLSCDYSQLSNLDLSGYAVPLDYFSCEGNVYMTDSPVRVEDLPGNFDPEKVSNLTGAAISSDGLLTLTEPYATYTYDCGNGVSASFRLKQHYAGPAISCDTDLAMVNETVTVRVADERTDSFSFVIENEAGETFYPGEFRDWSREEEENVRYYIVPMKDFGPSGTLRLKVCAWLDGDIQTEYSELSFDYINNGRLEKLSSDLPETHDLGQPLTVTLENVAEGSELTCSLRMYYEDGSYRELLEIWDGNVINYGAEEFAEPGRYLFTAQQRKTGWVESHVYEKEFTVEGDIPPAPAVTVNAQNVLKDDTLVFTIRAEGMTKFRYRSTEGGEYDTFDTPRVVDGVTTYSTWVHEVRDWDYSFSALVNGIWSEWSEPLAIHVYSLGTLETPELELSETWRAGESISVNIPETPEGTELSMTCASVGETPYYHRYFSELTAGENLIFPFGLDAGTYELCLSASAIHYESGEDKTFRFTVEGVRPGAPALDIPESYTVGAIVPIRISAENMDAAALEKYWGDYEIYHAENGTAMIPYLASAVKVAFRARVNGLWSEKTEEVCLPSQEEFYGGQPGPELTMADRIALGEDLPVQVGPVPGAGWYAYNVSWHDPEEDEWTDIIYEKYIDAGSGSLTIPSAELSLPGDYRITVNVYLADDYCTYLCATTEELTVYTDGQQDPAPVASVQKDNWLVGEDILFSVSQPAGADTLRAVIYYDSEDWSWLEDTRTVEFPADGILRLNFEDDGSYRAIFATRRNGTWSEFSAPVTFTVEAPMEDLPGVRIQAPAEAVIGEGLRISWTSAEGAEQYELYLSRYDSTGDVFHIVLGSDVTEYTLDTGDLSGLTGGIYNVGILTRAVGFSSGWGSGKISMLDPAIRPAVSQVSADGGQAVIRVTGIVSERLRLRINGKDAGYLSADPGQSTRDYRLPMTSDPMMVSVANYGSNPAAWSAWSAPVSVSSAVTLYPDSIVLPEELTVIEKEAFAGIRDGVNIVCGANIREIDPEAFGNSQVLLVVPPDSYALQWAEAHDVPYLVRAE